jgi:hypothetical protein
MTKYIKLFVISVAILGGILLCVSLMLPATVKVSRTAWLRAGEGTVDSALDRCTIWKHLLPGLEQANMVSGNDKTCIFESEGKKLTIKPVKSERPHARAFELFQQNKFSGVYYFETVAQGDSTAIVWTYLYETKGNLARRFQSLVSERSMGMVMQQGLNALKKELEL